MTDNYNNFSCNNFSLIKIRFTTLNINFYLSKIHDIYKYNSIWKCLQLRGLGLKLYYKTKKNRIHSSMHGILFEYV